MAEAGPATRRRGNVAQLVEQAQAVEKLAAKEGAHDLDGEDIAPAEGQPGITRGSEAAAGHDAVQVGMEEQVPGPGMQHRGDAE